MTSAGITAPVIDGGRVYVTCFDGSSLCFDAASGDRLWVRHNGATSAPVIAGGQMVLTEKATVAGNVREGLKRFDARAGAERDTTLLAAGNAGYLKAGGASTTLATHAQHALDASVGFASAPSSAGLAKAADRIGVSTVAGGWAYQGSKAAVRGGQILNAQGQTLNCVAAKDGRIAWQAEARGKGVDPNAQLFAPPALGCDNLYACTSDGHVLAVRQKDGATLFAYATGKPMAFQPALWNGRIFAGTSDGMILCLATGDKDADGWSAWGGNAQHNKGE
jgi:outer membrane protein assembly factor BamB